MFNNCHLKGQRCSTAKVAAFELKMKLLKPEPASAECRERMLQETQRSRVSWRGCKFLFKPFLSFLFPVAVVLLVTSSSCVPPPPEELQLSSLTFHTVSCCAQPSYVRPELWASCFSEKKKTQLVIDDMRRNKLREKNDLREP